MLSTVKCPIMSRTKSSHSGHYETFLHGTVWNHSGHYCSDSQTADSTSGCNNMVLWCIK